MADTLLSKSSDSALTIVVPVHNMSGRLSNLSSWLDEAHEFNLKVILVHDKSNDSTNIELEELVHKKESVNLSILNVQVQSPGLARNAGLAQVDTPWFSFADADDVVCVPELVALLKKTQSSGCNVGIGAYSSINLKNGSEKVNTPPDYYDERLASHLAKTMGLWRFVFLSEEFKDEKFTSHRMGEDFIFTNIVLSKSNRICTSSEIVYRYFYGGEQNLTSNKSIMNEMFGVIEVLERLDSNSRIGNAFRIFAIQKLSLSLLKNLSVKEAIVKKIFLCKDLMFHPLYLKKLLFE